MFNEKHQAKLDEVTEAIVDLEEQIELVGDETSAEYVPQPGTEDHVHLSIVRGRRFNPNTGKEESLPYVQVFTRGEFELFKVNAHLLGYSVLKVLHDPTGEASKMVVK